ncbi:kri1 [Candida pseudojiufengensis]|uniref:kri1 n=1 Tax=Candida pseudojiufengensis TaxID=497109 RepID=UPI0022258148|nr:kri1 [Candida pseudojiufengensis]KAI5960457.1 kri1 [Candida pseudojiufengensis]
MARKKSAAKKAKEAALKEKNETPPTIAKSDTNLTNVNNERKQQIQSEPQTQDIDSDSESTTSEEEDEYGDLITDDVEDGINKVLEAIKSNPNKLLDPNVKFFNEPSIDSTSSNKSKSEKPIYLKDYHRQNLIDGSYKEFDESETVDGGKSFASEQREDRNKLLDDIKNAFNEDEDDDEEDDGFMKKKTTPSEEKSQIEKTKELPDPEKDQKGFLSAFLDQKAWIPQKGDKVINLDKIDQNDEEEFDDAVEDFENAYNFRFEDPNSTEIISYARNQATLRRSNTNVRKRKREKENEEKQKEEKIKEEKLKKKKISKLNKVIDRLSKIKEAVGEDVDDAVIQKVFGDSLLNDDFDDADWDSKMAEIFNEQYYGAEDAKPTWDDEIMDGFDYGNEEGNEDYGEEEHDNEFEEEPPKKKSKKDQLKDKKSAKKEKELIKQKAQEIVDSNTLKIQEEIDEEQESGRGRSKSKNSVEKFKYREVSPETFGLTTRDILLADDKQLNNLIGLKKFAPYRPKELRMKDKRKLTKSKHLKEWRKETFQNLHIPEDAKDDEIWIPNDQSEEQSSRKKFKLKDSKKHKKHSSRKA